MCELNMDYSPSEIITHLMDEHGNFIEKIAFYVEMEFENEMQLRLTCVERCDQMYVSTINPKIYTQLKTSQALNVSFTAFANNLRAFLNECLHGSMQMNFLQKDNNCFELQFVEERPFRSLVHLALPLEKASSACIISHMRNKMQLLQEISEHNEKEIKNLTQQLSELHIYVDKLKFDSLANKKKMDEQLKLIAIQEENLTARKKLDENYFECKLSKLRKLVMRLRKQNMEKLESESYIQRENDMLHQNIQKAKNQIFAFKFQTEKLTMEIQENRRTITKLMQEGELLRHQHAKLNDLLVIEKKKQCHLKASLEAEKKMAESKQETLKVAVEEKSKAEEIILDLVNQVIRLKQSINWRTDIALKQEQIIQKHRTENLAVFKYKSIFKLSRKLRLLGIQLEKYNFILKDLQKCYYKLVQI